MKKFLLIVAVALNLASCAGFNAFVDETKAVATDIRQTLTPDNYDTVTASYAAVEATGDAYRSSCERKLINKSCWKVIAKLQPYEDKAYTAYVNLKFFVHSNPNGDALSLITALKTAISAFKSAQLSNGVQ